MSKFKVLWIDDQLAKVDLEMCTVRDIISELGFNPRIKTLDKISIDDVSIGSQLACELSSREYDLLFIDYKLSRNILGSQIISEIRKNNNIFVDIVFYSSDKDQLIGEIKKTFDGSILEYFDDVHIVPLDEDDFREKIEKVVNKITRSWFNPKAVRGIILSKASKFEHLVSDLIRLHYKDHMTNIKNGLHVKGENVVNSVGQKWNRVFREDDPIEIILNDPIGFNFETKKCIIKAILDGRAFEISTWKKLCKFFATRNDFAHNPVKIYQGKLYLIKQGISYEYTEKQINEIRNDMNEIEEDLENLIKDLSIE